MTTFRQIIKYLIIVILILLPFYLLFEYIDGNFKDKVNRKPNAPSYKRPVKTSTKNLRFIVMADSRGSEHGVNSKVVTKIMGQINKLNPQPKFAIMPGDLVGGGTSYPIVKGQLEYFKKLVTKYYPEEFFYTGVGNHEVDNRVNGERALGEVFGKYKATFLKGYNRSVYYFDKGNTRLFMINSNHPGSYGRINEEQLSWLKKSIKPSTKHNLYFFHEPAYPTGPHVGSSLDGHPLERDKLWKVIDHSNSPLVFCGHEHFYTRRHIDSAFNQTFRGESFNYTKNVYQVTVGSFGAPLYRGFSSEKNVDVPPIHQYHFAVVDIIDNKVKTTVYNIDGKVIDSFGIN